MTTYLRVGCLVTFEAVADTPWFEVLEVRSVRVLVRKYGTREEPIWKPIKSIQKIRSGEIKFA